jgi:hypothetical protein
MMSSLGNGFDASRGPAAREPSSSPSSVLGSACVGRLSRPGGDAPLDCLETAGRHDGAARAPRYPTVATVWRELWKGVFDPYRPERHYMRGPGPRWRERHGARQANGLSQAVNALAGVRS